MSLRGVNAFRGNGGQSEMVRLLPENGRHPKRKTIAPVGSKVFLFRVNGPFSEGARCAGKRTGSHKSCFKFTNKPVYQMD